MKYILLIAVVFTTVGTSMSVSAQPIDPIPFNIDSINFPGMELLRLKGAPQNGFALGYNWGIGTEKLNDALKVNYFHTDISTSHPVGEYMYSHTGIGGSKWDSMATNGYAMHFSPLATVLSGHTMPEDTSIAGNTAAAFGFLHKSSAGRDTVFYDTIDVGTAGTVMRPFTTRGFVLDGTTRDTVLKNPYPDDEYWYIQHWNKGKGNRGADGMQWFCSVNLRLLDPTDTSNMDSTLLEIELPYEVYTDIGTVRAKIVFSEPSTFADISVVNALHTVQNSRANPEITTRTYYVSTGNFSTFKIKRSMLPTNTNGIQNVTVSAFFELADINDDNPYRFPTYSTRDSNAIHRMGCNVVHTGNAPIAINWVRIETPFANYILQGKRDGRILEILEGVLDYFRTTAPAGIKIHSLFSIDECLPMHYHTMRYLNKLFDGRLTSETDPGFFPHYKHIVGLDDYWFTGAGVDANVAAPHVRKGHFASQDKSSSDSIFRPYRDHYLSNSSAHLGNVAGYGSEFGAVKEVWYEGRLNGLKDGIRHEYKMEVDNVLDTIPGPYGSFHVEKSLNLLSEEEYLAVLKNVRNVNGHIEQQTQWYVKAEAHIPFNTKFIFADEPFWSNPWIMSNWEITFNGEFFGNASHQYGRSKTGEEFRWMMNLPLMLGAKGLIYYTPMSVLRNLVQHQDTTDHMAVNVGFMGIHPGDTLPRSTTGIEYLKDPSLGGDFLQFDPDGENHIHTTMATRDIGIRTTLHTVQVEYVSDPSTLDRFIPYLTTSATAMRIPKERIYLGGMTQRMEMYHRHTWIKDNEDLLMSLKLKSWYGNGFRDIKEHRTPADESNYYAFFSDNIHTEHISGFNGIDSLHTQNRLVENPDSSFADMMVHDDDDDLYNGFYLGVLNRRVNPVVINDTNDKFTLNGSSDFVGTIVGRDLPGLQTDQEYRFLTTLEFDTLVAHGQIDSFAQLGSRRLIIPFNYEDTTGHYGLIRIQEVVADGVVGFDTVIGQDKSLALNFKPGEGKLFKVTMQAVDTTVNGHLKFSNQRKIVSAPLDNDSTAFRYHMVYHKYDNGRAKIYYRRSQPIPKLFMDSLDDYEDSSVVRWEREIHVSPRFVAHQNNDTLLQQDVQCLYPSLVVRKNGTPDDTSKREYVYVVYYSTPDTSEQHYVVEHIFPANQSLTYAETRIQESGKSVEYHYDHQYQLIDGDMMVPVINASWDGNFIVWTIPVDYTGSQEDGVYCLFQEPVDTVTHTDTLFLQGGALHPSVNSYSRWHQQETEAAAVWNRGGRIEYCVFTYDDITKTVGYKGHQVIDTAYTSALPTVYRSIEQQSEASAGEVYYDVCYWEGEAPFTIGFGQTGAILTKPAIKARQVTYSQYLPEHWSDIWFFNIFKEDPFSKVLRPNLAQGNVRLDAAGLNESDSAYVVNINLEEFGHNSVVHIPMNYNFSLSALHGGKKFVDRPFQGKYPHLSARSSVTNEIEYRDTRRIFEFGDDTPPLIVASSQHFYRTSFGDALSVVPIPSFTADSGRRYGIFGLHHETATTQEELKYNTISLQVDTNTMQIVENQEVTTEWFAANDGDLLFFHSIGSTHDFVQVELVRQSDGVRFSVPLEDVNPTYATVQAFTITNTGQQNYRMEFTPTQTSKYVEDMVFGGVPIGAAGGGIRATVEYNDVGTKLLDLSETQIHTSLHRDSPLQIALYPNPVSEILTVALKQSADSDGSLNNAQLQVRLTNIVGQTITEFTTVVGRALRLDVSTLPAGTYFVHAQDDTGTLRNVSSFVVK